MERRNHKRFRRPFSQSSDVAFFEKSCKNSNSESGFSPYLSITWVKNPISDSPKAFVFNGLRPIIPYPIFSLSKRVKMGPYEFGKKVADFAYLPGSCRGSKRHFRASSPIFWYSLASASIGVSSLMLNWKHFRWQFQIPHLTPGRPR